MITMTIECVPGPQFIDLSDEMLESFFKYSGVSQYRKLCFAVHELVINAVEATLKQRELSQLHVGEDQSDRNGESKISIRMELTEEDIVITISNYADPCDRQVISALPKLNFDDLLQEERGRGLLIAKRLSDQLTFKQDNEGRITMELRKKGGVAHG